ncbi:hypothetical protein AtNW77_Chr5g0125891 [Arabidopsis thaliana]|uniref:Transmembrane protein n=1 Tax=Arabidopsis thaliana TaxID=3702 RepID=A0A5S9YAS7_ARATH|nr:unnamed protein product [Arabidopsis thaliana]VYS69110.1 unnamed protein product [Arabidopsis thaliana]
MENKNVFVLCVVLFLVSSSLMFEGGHCRTLRSKPFRDTNGHDQSSATMKVKHSSESFAFRLASGSSKRGRGH